MPESSSFRYSKTRLVGGIVIPLVRQAAPDEARPKRGWARLSTRPQNGCETRYRGHADRSSSMDSTTGIWESVGVREPLNRIVDGSHVVWRELLHAGPG
jgi:hypothetical protein